MSTSKRVFTGRQILEALEADAIPLKRGNWFDSVLLPKNVSAIGSACSLGIVCINLGVTNGSLQDALDEKRDKEKERIGSAIIHKNDNHASWASIVTYAREALEPYLDDEFTLNTEVYLSVVGKS